MGMRGLLFSALQVFRILGASACTDDCTCGDWYFDNCGRHVSSQSIHTGSFEECSLYQTFGQCSYFTFDINQDVHDTCKLYNHDPQKFLESCGVYGQPLFDSHGNPLTESECHNHSENPCGGFRNLDCILTHAPIRHFENIAQKEKCAMECRKVPGASYSVHNAESKLCECYNSGTRECAFIMVDQDGTVDC